MVKVISECPACGTKMRIATLRCPDCGLELRNDFQLSPFDSLDAEQTEFLFSFLKQRGNISSVQAELGISYPAAKKRLDSLLAALGLADSLRQAEKEVPDMSNWVVQKDSIKASDIIKRKLMENNGKAVVYSAQGLPCEIWCDSDGVSFHSNKLPNNPVFRFEVFDVVVSLLASQGGRARKGNGRNHKLGAPGCDETTVVGAVGFHYFHAAPGSSVLDPVFVLAAVLEWAGIAENGRGELVLTASYYSMLRSAAERG